MLTKYRKEVSTIHCVNHPDKEVHGACTYCGKFFCKDCLVDVDGKSVCKDDVTKVYQEAKTQQQQPTPAVYMNAGGGGGGAASSAAASSGGGRRGRYPRNSLIVHIILLFFTCGIGNILYFLYVKYRQHRWEDF